MRRLIAVLASGVLAALAGCVVAAEPDDDIDGCCVPVYETVFYEDYFYPVYDVVDFAYYEPYYLDSGYYYDEAYYYEPYDDARGYYDDYAYYYDDDYYYADDYYADDYYADDYYADDYYYEDAYYDDGYYEDAYDYP